MNRILLFRRQVALQPDKGAPGFELGRDIVGVETRQSRSELPRRIDRSDDRATISIERRRDDVGRVHFADAIENNRAVDRRFVLGRDEMPLKSVAEESKMDQPSKDHRKARGKEAK